MVQDLLSKNTFPDKDRIDNIILRNPSPFILQTTTKSNIPEIFIGRNDEIKIIIETLKRVVENNSCIALYIEGAGGSGKSTLYGHVFRAIKQKKYELIDLKEDYKLDAVFIDAPEDPEYCDILHIYNEIMQNLGKSSFIDEISFKCLKKVLEIIESKYKGENPIKNIKNLEDYFTLENNKEIYDKCIQIFKKHYKILRSNENFNFDWHFIEKLWLVLYPDFDTSIKAVEELSAIDIGKQKLINNKTDASKTFNTITNLIGWLYGNKKVGIVVGIDNIESLLGSKKEEKFDNFINMLLDFRNKVNRTLLVIIGTTSTWMEFLSFLKNSDYYNQFQGLFSSTNISLKFLELAQINQIIKKNLDLLYNQYSLTLPIDYSLYPFSPEAIEYLYIISAKNIRNLKKYLNDLWEGFQEKKKVEYISDAFKIMKCFKTDITLDDYEINILYNKLWSEKIKTTGKRSNLVENALKNAFGILKAESQFQIYNVENNPQIKIVVDDVNKMARPDVLVTLSSKYNIGEMKKIEFQVKIYETNNNVLKNHVVTSKNLLEQNKLDYVYFVTTAEFSRSLVSELKEKYPERIGGVFPLTKTQQAYLSLLVFYENIFHKDLTPSIVKILLKNSLGIDIGEFFDNIKKLPKISITPITQPTLDTFEKVPIVEEFTDSRFETKTNIISIDEEKEPQLVKVIEKQHPPVIEDILLFMYRRAGRYKWQATSNYLKGKLTNFRDEEVKDGFIWLRYNSNYVDPISTTSVKLNQNAINFLKNLKKI